MCFWCCCLSCPLSLLVSICLAPGYIGCFYVYNPSGYSPIFWTYKAYSDWSVGTCVQEGRRLYGQDSDFPQYLGVRQPVCWFNLRLSRLERRRRSDAMCDFNCFKTAGEECGGSTTIAVYDGKRVCEIFLSCFKCKECRFVFV